MNVPNRLHVHNSRLLALKEKGEYKKKRPREFSRWGPVKKRRRWGKEKVEVPEQIVNIASANLNEKETGLHLMKMRLQELQASLMNVAAYVASIPESQRDPSPEPVYDSKGSRINTRERRTKENLLRERAEVIQDIIVGEPDFVPPSDYKKPRLQKRLMIPIDDYPDYDFFGLLIGVRGSTQQRMQQETNCAISVRGKGSFKKKIGRTPAPDDNDPPYVLITADKQEDVDKASAMIEQLLIPIEGDEFTRKADQLRQLALVHGGALANGKEGFGRFAGVSARFQEHGINKSMQSWILDSDLKKTGGVVPDGAVRGNERVDKRLDQEYKDFMTELMADGTTNSRIAGRLTSSGQLAPGSRSYNNAPPPANQGGHTVPAGQPPPPAQHLRPAQNPHPPNRPRYHQPNPYNRPGQPYRPPTAPPPWAQQPPPQRGPPMNYHHPQPGQPYQPVGQPYIPPPPVARPPPPSGPPSYPPPPNAYPPPPVAPWQAQTVAPPPQQPWGQPPPPAGHPPNARQGYYP